MASRFLTILTGRNLPRIIGQSREPEPLSTINKTIADFTRVVEQTGILERGQSVAPDTRQPEEWMPTPELTRQSADHRHNCCIYISAMFMSGRLPSASAMTPIRGNGAAASIRATGRVK
jgi:hypothetical protein